MSTDNSSFKMTIAKLRSAKSFASKMSFTSDMHAYLLL